MYTFRTKKRKTVIRSLSGLILPSFRLRVPCPPFFLLTCLQSPPRCCPPVRVAVESRRCPILCSSQTFLAHFCKLGISVQQKEKQKQEEKKEKDWDERRKESLVDKSLLPYRNSSFTFKIRCRNTPVESYPLSSRTKFNQCELTIQVTVKLLTQYNPKSQQSYGETVKVSNFT